MIFVIKEEKRRRRNYYLIIIYNKYVLQFTIKFKIINPRAVSFKEQTSLSNSSSLETLDL